MALRMSQMLRTADDVRGTRSTKKQTSASSARKKAVQREEEPLPAELSAAAGSEPAPPAVRSDSEVYQRLIRFARQIFTAAREGQVPDEKVIIRALRAGMKKLREDEGLLSETMRQHGGVPDLAQRGADSAILSMRLGLELGAEDKRCLAVGLCGLMHDLGMLKVPEEILQEGQLSAKGMEILKRHPLESRRILEDFGSAFAWVGRIVVQVHERRDGSGYPRGLSREEIHEIAQLVGLADAYLAMAHPRADRPGLVVYNALKEVIDKRRTLFDNQLVKALINIVSIFPLGSLVKLNNNEIGRVIGTSHLHPTRPKVEILLDSRGRSLKPPRQLVLEEEPMVYIVNPAIEEDILKKNNAREGMHAR
jgi:hypothetical protein